MIFSPPRAGVRLSGGRAVDERRARAMPARGGDLRPEPSFVPTPLLDLALERLRRALPAGWEARREGRRYVVSTSTARGGWAVVSHDPLWLAELVGGRT